jgi:hypothetical protein
VTVAKIPGFGSDFFATFGHKQSSGLSTSPQQAFVCLRRKSWSACKREIWPASASCLGPSAGTTAPAVSPGPQVQERMGAELERAERFPPLPRPRRQSATRLTAFLAENDLVSGRSRQVCRRHVEHDLSLHIFL